MKESEFIKQNKEKWLEFENNLLKNDGDPSKTAKLFIQITDDLSYARTFYQNRSVRLYLNGSAKVLFNDLNKSRKKRFQSFLNFWKKDLPLAVYKAKRPMLISFCIFIACFALGIITSLQDKNFASQILSVSYVDMTEANIKKGDAMGVYKSDDELHIFFGVLYNNLRVDFLTFFSGIFMAIGTLVVMITNGIMVGVFQYFFIERGLFWESFLGIWTHGALEIPTIVLSGGAGLMLGKGLLFPGTYSRFQAFKLSGMTGLKIIMGVVPVTVMAAFIEGFLTRHTDIPNVLRFTFILLSFAFIIVYFVVYPRRVARREDNTEDRIDHALVYKPPFEFDASEIYSSGKIITETFRHLLSNFVFFGKWIISFGLICAFIVAVNPLTLFHDGENYSFGINFLFNYEEYPLLGILTVFCLTASCLLFVSFMKSKLQPEGKGSAGSFLAPKTLLTTFILMLVFAFIIFTGLDFMTFVAHLLLPFFVFLICISYYESLTFYECFQRGFAMLNQSWGRFIAVITFFALISFIILLTAMQGTRVLMLNNALTWIITDDEVTASKLSLGLSVFENFFSLYLYLALMIISGSLLYFTLKEIGTAANLIAKIRNIKSEK
ncbi:MAG: stage II sporulation protein M [Bacteroidia bacterium]|nr:stage II sporulation protein M [Bacteroidia bacterium]